MWNYFLTGGAFEGRVYADEGDRGAEICYGGLVSYGCANNLAGPNDRHMAGLIRWTARFGSTVAK